MKRWNEEGNDGRGERSRQDKARHEECNLIGKRYQTTSREIESDGHFLKVKISCFQ